MLGSALEFMLEEMAFDPISGCEGYPCLMTEDSLEAVPHTIMDKNRPFFKALANRGMAGVIKPGLASGSYYLFTFEYKHATLMGGY